MAAAMFQSFGVNADQLTTKETDTLPSIILPSHSTDLYPQKFTQHSLFYRIPSDWNVQTVSNYSRSHMQSYSARAHRHLCYQRQRLRETLEEQICIMTKAPKASTRKSRRRLDELKGQLEKRISHLHM